jgi:hypothetical protein
MALSARPLTTGNFTQSDESELEKRLVLVFKVPEVPDQLAKKASTARNVYLDALKRCSAHGFLQFVCSYSITACHDHQRSARATFNQLSEFSCDLHSNTREVLFTIRSKRNDFADNWDEWISRLGIKATGLTAAMH